MIKNMPQQRLILCALFLTVTYATTINFFDAQADLPILGNQSTIFATHIQLWADVTDCPSSCDCKVQSNTTNDMEYSIKFLPEKPNIGYTDVEDLQPDTLYSFTLSCTGAAQSVLSLIRTDYGRPSAPRDIRVELNANSKLQIFWSPPLVPAGPIHGYRLTVNGIQILDNIPNGQSSYTLPESYVSGTTVRFILSACNKNRQNNTICSSADNGQITYPTSPIQTTTTTAADSSTVVSSVLLLSTSLISLFLF